MKTSKVVITISFPVEEEGLSGADIFSTVDKHFLPWVKELNKNLTNTEIFGKIVVDKIELEGIEDARQFKFDLEDH